MESKVCMQREQGRSPTATTHPRRTCAAIMNCLLRMIVSKPSTDEGTADTQAPACSQVSRCSLCFSRSFGASSMRRLSLALSISNEATFCGSAGRFGAARSVGHLGVLGDLPEAHAPKLRGQ